MTFKLCVAMESDAATDGIDTDEVAAAATATEVEAGAGEIEAGDTEVSKVADGVDTGVDATADLGEVHDLMASSVESGEGMSEETAKMAEIAVEAICARVGISARQERLMPAMEGFGSTRTRLSHTKIAMETIKETATRIWESIKKACAWVWNLVSNFFVGLTKNRKLMEKHLANLKEKANALSGGPKETTFKTSAAAFSIGKKAGPDTAKKILENSVSLLGVAGAAATTAMDIVKGLETDKPEQIDPALITNLFERIPAATGAKGTKTEGGKAYGTYTGGRSIVVGSTGEGKEKTLTLKLEVVNKDLASEIKAPNKAEILEVLKSAEDTLKALVDYEKVKSLLEKANKAATDYANTMTSLSAKSADTTKENDDVKSSINKGATAIRNLNKIASTLGAQVPGTIFSAVKAAADYVNAGINNHGEKDKKK